MADSCSANSSPLNARLLASPPMSAASYDSSIELPSSVKEIAPRSSLTTAGSPNFPSTSLVVTVPSAVKQTCSVQRFMNGAAPRPVSPFLERMVSLVVPRSNHSPTSRGSSAIGGSAVLSNGLSTSSGTGTAS